MLSKKLQAGLLAAAIVPVALATGCAHPYYDPYYHDYHPVHGEVVYYNQWERSTHRDHVELKQRNADEQKQYWDWRHSQGNPH